jgi:hypothetical protein
LVQIFFEALCFPVVIHVIKISNFSILKVKWILL